MQVLEHSPEITTYSDETGDYVRGFLIGTKRNDANWRINKETGHEQVKQFVGTDFAIIPELIKTPLSKGGGGHYFGRDTLEDLLKGYADNSHGKYHKILGPFSYNDGTDDYFYNAIIKLRDSKAASELVKHGAETWVPYSISPHIWPLEGPDHDIRRWQPIGGALVIKGAFGPQAIISKMCKGTAAQCEKSLGASCTEKDTECSQIISSIVSKSASTQTEMAENIPNTVTNAPTVPELKPEPKIETPVNQLSITAEELEKIKKEAAEAEKKTWMEKVTALETKDKINTLNLVWGKIKDQAVRDTVIQYYQDKDVELVKRAVEDALKHLSQQEEEEKPPAEEGEKPKGLKSKGASLPKEPELPKEESKTASIPVNKLQEILRFQMSGGRA